MLLSISLYCPNVDSPFIFLVLVTSVTPELLFSFPPNLSEETVPTEAEGTKTIFLPTHLF